MSEVSSASYYAIIPASVRYDKNVCPNAKLLYGEITALCNQKGFCWASNSYFAELYGVGKPSISRWVKELIDGGYINSSIEYKQGTKEIVHRYLKICVYPTNKNMGTPTNKNMVTPTNTNVDTPTHKNAIDNTTVINTTRKNNTKRAEPFADYTSSSSSLPPAIDEIKQAFEQSFHPIFKATELDALSAYIDDYGRMGVLNAIETAGKRKNLNHATLSPRYLLPILKNPMTKPDEPQPVGPLIPKVTETEKEMWARLKREDDERRAKNVKEGW